MIDDKWNDIMEHIEQCIQIQLNKRLHHFLYLKMNNSFLHNVGMLHYIQYCKFLICETSHKMQNLHKNVYITYAWQYYENVELHVCIQILNYL